jgi:hypothetical protein
MDELDLKLIFRALLFLMEADYYAQGGRPTPEECAERDELLLNLRDRVR